MGDKMGASRLLSAPHRNDRCPQNLTCLSSPSPTLDACAHTPFFLEADKREDTSGQRRATLEKKAKLSLEGHHKTVTDSLSTFYNVFFDICLHYGIHILRDSWIGSKVCEHLFTFACTALFKKVDTYR